MGLVDAAKQALADGEVIGLPTDTVYGLAADPQNLDAMARIYELKGRPEGKPVGLLVASLNQALEVVRLNKPARALAEKHWPGPLTLIAWPTVVLPSWVGHRVSRSVGVRVPDHAATLEILSACGPLAVTSANRSDESETFSDAEAERIFGDSVAVWIPGDCPGGAASTVVDATGRRLNVIRQGPVTI